MHEAFRRYVESLHPSFGRLMEMRPVKIAKLPKPLPKKCVYLFSEGDRHLYVGRTKQLRGRLRQHSIPAAGHNQAVFAFKLAREKTGKTKAAYTPEGSRKSLTRDPVFAAAFGNAKARVRQMDLRFVEEVDPRRQALLETYVAIVLETPYNDFETH
jgi:predicted GIY-YIG superfamily endonuclease